MILFVKNMLNKPINIKDLGVEVGCDNDVNLCQYYNLINILDSNDLIELLSSRYLVLSTGGEYLSSEVALKYLKSLRQFINDPEKVINYFDFEEDKKNTEVENRINSKKIYSTGIKAKREHWHKFAGFIENQFNHGGDKYSLPDQPDKEMTDLLCEMSPGKTGIDWVLQTITKYCGRFINFEREKDLFKIATFAYIAWLKKGYHLQDKHDEDTEKEKED